MDPVTILGAVGSVVGIAAFGLQLAQFLDNFIDNYHFADNALNAILHSVRSTSKALNQVEELLTKEKKNRATQGKAVLFSAKAISDVQSMADECLKIFWRIEGTILRKDNPKDLENFVLQKSVKWYRAVALSPEGNPPSLTLDVGQELSRKQRFSWTYSIGKKLEHHIVQLDRLQNTLILMLQVVNLNTNLPKP
jgi:hypothetical protein